MTDAKFRGAMWGSIGAGVLAVGAFLALSSPAKAASAADVSSKPVTFAKDVAPILQAKCQECHHPGTAAPMSLMTYEETRPWARAIKVRVLSRTMPPWHIDRTVGIQKFKNDMSLSDEQIDTIVRWVDSGAPLGDVKDLPPARKWPTEVEWQLAKEYGPPELVLKTTPYTVKAQGQDVWWKPLVDVPVTEPRWVRAVEASTGTTKGRRVTHHFTAQLFQDEPGSRPEDHPVDSSQGGLFMEWAVGKNFDAYAPNTGKLLLPGAKLRLEVHYHSVGEEIRDDVELALYLYPKGVVPKYRTRLISYRAGLNNGIDAPTDDPVIRIAPVLDIPPNTITQHEGYHVLPEPARLQNFQPHMHLRGKAMAMEAILPDGTRRMLSYVDRFDFQWMTNYIYDDDVAPVLPKGTVLHVIAWHDNTTANRNNPDPNQWVGWGDRTVDEMAHAWVNVTYISEDEYKEYVAKQKANQAKADTDPH